MRKFLLFALCSAFSCTVLAEVSWRIVVPENNGPSQTHGMSPTSFSPTPQKTHMGMDIMADCGKNIYPMLPGEVVSVNNSSSTYFYATGNAVIVKHAGEGLWTTYFHMQNTPSVVVGEMVGHGSVLGEIGATGAGSGCHTHFEIRKFHFASFENGWFHTSSIGCGGTVGIYPCGNVSGASWVQNDWEDPETYTISNMQSWFAAGDIAWQPLTAPCQDANRWRQAGTNNIIADRSVQSVDGEALCASYNVPGQCRP